MNSIPNSKLLQVHAMFGYTLTLAGVTRIIEVSFIAPKFTPEPAPSQDDNDGKRKIPLSLASSFGIGYSPSSEGTVRGWQIA